MHMGLANDLSTYYLHSRETSTETIREEKDLGITFNNTLKYVHTYKAVITYNRELPN